MGSCGTSLKFPRTQLRRSWKRLPRRRRKLIERFRRRHKPASRRKYKMQEISFEKAVDQVRAKDSRYAPEAYSFLREALDYTRKLVAKDGRGRRRHVSGQELLGGIREH